MWYEIEVLDSDNYELTRDEVEGLPAAKERARYFLSKEYSRAIESLDSNAHKVNVYRLGSTIKAPTSTLVWSTYR
jgi:hypothetical protein